MEPLGVERKLTTILALDMVSYRRFMSADGASMRFAINNAFDLMHVGESIRTLVVSLSLNG